MSIPGWLQAHLTDRGRWDSDRISRRTGVRRCPDCRRRIYAGLDAELIAGVAHADLDPVSALGEAAARLLGLRTYALRWNLEYLTLDLRDQWSILGQPAGGSWYDVVHEHDCGIVALPSAPSRLADNTRGNYNLEPPY